MRMRNKNIVAGDVGKKKRTKLALEEIINIGKRFRQLGLYLFIWYWYYQYRDGADLNKLWRFYNNISNHVVHPETVRKQLKMLQAKGLVKKRNGKFYPVPMSASISSKMFDVKRSRVGRKGAGARLRQIVYRDQLPLVRELPKGLRHYVKQVVTKAVQLAGQGRREVALDILVHILLPVRENGVLWLWRDDEFIYYERKTMREGSFHSVRFPVLSDILRELGFKEGIMVYHVLGHKETRSIIHRIFGKGHLSWPWARSVFYKLKQLGFAEEGNYYIIEIRYKDMMLFVYLKELYSNVIKEYLEPWLNENRLPQPLSPEKKEVKYLVIGKQHIKPENEESYFSKW